MNRTKIAGITLTTVEPEDVLFLQSVVTRSNSGVTQAEFNNDTDITAFDGLVDLVRLNIDPSASGYMQAVNDIFGRFYTPPTAPTV
jgi:hypothetical protein